MIGNKVFKYFIILRYLQSEISILYFIRRPDLMQCIYYCLRAEDCYTKTAIVNALHQVRPVCRVITFPN